MRISLLMIILFLMGPVLLLAQNGYNKKQKRLYEEADSYLVYGDYQTAAKYFTELVEQMPSDHLANYKLGVCHYRLKHWEMAQNHLEQAKKEYVAASYFLAAVGLRNMELNKAEKELQTLLKSEQESEEVSREEMLRLSETIAYAKQQIANAEEVEIVNLGAQINSEFADYVPLITADESDLYFTSRRPKEGGKLDPTGQPYEDVYHASRSEGGWSKASLIKGKVNSEGHDASAGLSPDGERLFVFRTNDNLIGGNLYESQYGKEGWSQPLEMEENVNAYESIEPSASLDISGSVLYFSSNRLGGEGGFDIYRVIQLPNGKWSLPKNLGPEINSPYDEDAPFIHPNGNVLYFSSKGHQTMGGYDVFYSERSGEDQWSVAQNMGVPTNTTRDDIYFVISADERHGYYSSDRAGGYGLQDIYMIDYLKKNLRQSVIRGKIIDQDTQSPLAAEISVVNLNTGDIDGVYRSKRESGGFIMLVNPGELYELLVEVEGYEEFIIEKSYSIDDLLIPQSLLIPLSPIKE